MKTVLLKGLTWVLILGAIVVTTFMIVSGSLAIFGFWHDEWSGWNSSWEVSDGVCNIAVVPVHGEILAYENQYGTVNDDSEMTSPEDVRGAMNLAEGDGLIQGVLLAIDSLGGSGAGGDAIRERLEDSFLPTAAIIGDAGTSAGYLIALGADSIIASPFSDVGSIGITMSYLDYTLQNESEGVSYVSLASAPYKDYMNPDKPLTAEERKLLERDLKVWHDYFVGVVKEKRNLSEEAAAKLADGSSMPGALALEAGLVDALGDRRTAREWFAQELGIPASDVIFCE